MAPMRSKIKVSQLKNLQYMQKRASEAAKRELGGIKAKSSQGVYQEKYLTGRDKHGGSGVL